MDICYNPSLPLVNEKWSHTGSNFFSKYASFPVFMQVSFFEKMYLLF